MDVRIRQPHRDRERVIPRRRYVCTSGVWTAWQGAPYDPCAKAPHVQDGERVIEQLIIIHDDGYARTYEVTPETFKAAPAPPSGDQPVDGPACPDGCTLYHRLEAPKQARIAERMMAERPFLGGCVAGRRLLSQHGASTCAERGHVRDVQMWDTTEAAWFSGRVSGAGKGNKQEWVVSFEDETIYEFDPTTTVWKLVRPARACVCLGSSCKRPRMRITHAHILAAPRAVTQQSCRTQTPLPSFAPQCCERHALRAAGSVRVRSGAPCGAHVVVTAASCAGH